MEREFTLEEARALIPALMVRLTLLQQAHAALAARSHDVAAGDGNGTGARAAASAAAQQRFVEALASVQELGVVVRDSQSGLVDFPARRGDEPIYLCWRVDEADVTHWHTREEGFSGRQPL